MGTYVSIEDCKINIRRQNFKSACDHLLSTSFLEENENMSGFSSEKGKITKRYYAWVDMTSLKNSLKQGDLAAVFKNFGFQVYIQDGNIVELAYNQKTGDEEYLLYSLREYFDEGDYIQWTGEDGDSWRILFDDASMHIQRPSVTWNTFEIRK